MAPKQSKTTLKDKVCSLIKEAIFQKKLKSDVIYSIAEIEKQFGVSRTPIREALQQLADGSFIEFMPKKGFIIKKFTIDEIDQLFEFRIYLEKLVIEKAMKVMDDLSIKKLQDTLIEGEKYIEQHNFDAALNEDAKFHNILSGLANNKFLTDSLLMNRDLIAVANSVLGKDVGNLFRSRNDHEIIFERIAARDTAGAIEGLVFHLETVKQRIKKKMIEYEKGKREESILGLSLSQ